MATLEKIQEKMKKLQAQAEALLAKQAQAAVDQIRALMLKHGLTTEEIEAKAKTKREAKSASVRVGRRKTAQSALGTKGKMPPKYRDPKTGATWSGHARPPAWIKDVKDRTKFLVAGASAAANTRVERAAKTARKKNAAVVEAIAHKGKGQLNGKQPAKYLNPKTGASWSGRGPAPAWLASVRDRTKFLIDGASSTADTGSVSKAKTKAVGKSAGAARKAAAEKAATKKVRTRKVVVAKTAGSKKASVPKAAIGKKAVVKAGVAGGQEAAAAQATA